MLPSLVSHREGQKRLMVTYCYHSSTSTHLWKGLYPKKKKRHNNVGVFLVPSHTSTALYWTLQENVDTATSNFSNLSSCGTSSLVAPFEERRNSLKMRWERWIQRRSLIFCVCNVNTFLQRRGICCHSDNPLRFTVIFREFPSSDKFLESMNGMNE